MNSKKLSVVLLTYFIVFLCGCSSRMNEKDVVFQVSSYCALKQGDFAGRMPIRELKTKGDFGIGTFDNIDGEMAELDGTIYQIGMDGYPRGVDNRIKVPFAICTFFSADKTVFLPVAMDHKEFISFLDGLIAGQSAIYAIKVEGIFDYIKLRSVPSQVKPYPALSEVIKNQAVFQARDIRGTLIGFWFPDYMEGVNVSGFHFHFISADKKSGGHLLDCKIRSAKIELDYSGQFQMFLSENW